MSSLKRKAASCVFWYLVVARMMSSHQITLRNEFIANTFQLQAVIAQQQTENIQKQSDYPKRARQSAA